MTNNQQIVIAIDPGYDRVGWAVGFTQGKKLTVTSYGLIQTSKQQTIFERFRTVEKELDQILDRYQPTVAALENLFFSTNRTSAMRVAETRGLLLATLLRREIECFEYNPGQIKLTVTGYGKADKRAVEKMVRLQLKLPTEKLIDDTLDALALLLTHTVSGPL